MQNEKINVEQAYRTLAVVWFVLLMSQGILMLFLSFVKPELFDFDFSQPLLGDDTILVLMLAIVSLSNFAISFVFRRKYINRAIAEQNVGLIQTAMIIGCSLCEAISLFGMLLAFTSDYQYFFLFFALGIFGIILHFPRRESIVAASYKL